MHTPLCDRLGVEFPIFAISHCRDVVAAVRRAELPVGERTRELLGWVDMKHSRA
jgi:hypothetical protein